MATFTYTRALLNLDGLHPRVQLCDAYLYGAPVVCDMASAKIFNDFMDHRKSVTGRIRNVWRVTNVSSWRYPAIQLTILSVLMPFRPCSLCLAMILSILIKVGGFLLLLDAC